MWLPQSSISQVKEGMQVCSTKWEQSPLVAPRSNPNAPVLNKGDVERLETPHGLLPQVASESLFLINKKNSYMDAY